MDNALTNTQIDRLGERLKTGEPSEADLRLLDRYRRSFMQPYEFVVKVVRDQLNLEPTGRPAKSTASVREKLRRESIRLSQMQDIAGCRVIVGGLIDQDRTVESLSQAFADSVTVDRRLYPSHGYRAVHVIVRHAQKPIEIQVRTTLQHLWSQWSEKVADVVDSALKYGGGTEAMRLVLDEGMRLIEQFELHEKDVCERINLARSAQVVPVEVDAVTDELHASIATMRTKLQMCFEEFIQRLSILKGERNAVPD